PGMNAFCFRIPLLEDCLAEARTWFVPPANMPIFFVTRFLRRAMPGPFEQPLAAQEAIAATCLCTPASSPAMNLSAAFEKATSALTPCHPKLQLPARRFLPPRPPAAIP